MRHRLEAVVAVKVVPARLRSPPADRLVDLDEEARAKLSLTLGSVHPRSPAIRRILSQVDEAEPGAAVGAWMWSRTTTTARVWATPGGGRQEHAGNQSVRPRPDHVAVWIPGHRQHRLRPLPPGSPLYNFSITLPAPCCTEYRFLSS